MEISNINDLSELIKEKQKVYTFRKLELKDAKDIQLLMTKSLVSDNEGMKILQVTEEDLNTEFNLKQYQWIIQENLSFGAFNGNQLVSACLTYDLSSNNDLYYEGPEPSEAMSEIQELVGFLLGEYSYTKSMEEKEIAYLSHLATKADHFKKHLALSCAYLSVEECRKLGFIQMICKASHIGTQKSISKIFKKFEKFKEINELKGQPVDIVSLIGTLSQQQI
ncbi:unnamed protein product [Paramecium pentaurelia]|uniref:Uncharacterized protein n=1 Tax=Paramecium pentaurelia TaxID=43138 RepID=A0A8S1ULZ2_9CILI|nr:unnamed protein product [Paramecium pentaurelia]